MKRLFWCALLLVVLRVEAVSAQNLAPAKVASPAAKKQRKNVEKKDDKDPIKSALAKSTTDPTQPITTEIYADEAFFDSANSLGIFTGHVIVQDPRFNVQSDKLTVYLSKTPKLEPGQTPPAKADPAAAPQQGLEKAVAEGNVGVVREQPGENGGPPTRSIGRADTAIYTTADGNVELRGSPRVQSGPNLHVATSPDTVMLLSSDNKLVTHGPSRTEIRQEPKPAETPKPSATPKP